MTSDTPHLLLNGTAVPLAGEHRISLADFVRERGATSVHLGCEHGVCGACNVLVDGACVRSCLSLAHGCAGSQVTTLDGLDDALARRLRTAFNTHHALQCGFCTPGMFVTAYDLLASGQPLDEATVRERLAGNICRCTGYQGIVDAILSVARDGLSPSDVHASGDAHVHA
jgi:aerobic-type carbon monoxide dehydrogenase small subunit (CoxS/CutS family)